MPESAFLLIANAAAQPGLVAVTYYTETGGGAARRHYDLPANGRVTVWPTQDNPQLPPGRYRAEVMSLPVGGAQAVDITVERSAYDGQFRTGTVVPRHADPVGRAVRRPRRQRAVPTSVGSLVSPKPTCISRAYSTVSPTKDSRTFILKGVS